MRNFKKMLLFSSAILLFLTACSDSESTSNTLDVTKENISAKWEVTSDVTYKSFEFNTDGKYIIVKHNNDQTRNENTEAAAIRYGNYTMVGNKVVLDNFGAITVNELSEDAINFEVTEGSVSKELNANAVIKIESSTNTDLLCRTWRMVKFDGELTEGTEYDLTVVFSRGGTYFVEFFDPVDDMDGGLAEWQWKNTDETTLCYSWEGDPTCDGENEVLVTVSQDKLIIVEGNLVHELEPYSGGTGRTARIKTFDKVLKKGFFVK